MAITQESEQQLRERLARAGEIARDVIELIPDDAHEYFNCRMNGNISQFLNRKSRRVTCWACIAGDKLGGLYKMSQKTKEEAKR